MIFKIPKDQINMTTLDINCKQISPQFGVIMNCTNFKED